MNARDNGRVCAVMAGIVGLSLSLGAAAQDLPARGPVPFAIYDKNGDGTVSETEFNAVRAQREAEDRPMRMAPSFASLDVNRDGQLSTKEFAAGQRPAGSGMHSGTPPRPSGLARGNMPAFSEFDLNSDGTITEQEFNDARALRIKERAEEGRMMRGMADGHAFSDLDTNHDGAVSPEEFAAHQAAQGMKMGR